MLRSLGVERYGVWVVITSFIGYYGLLDFGFRAGVSQFLTRTLAAGDVRQFSRIISSSVVVMSALGLVVILLTAVGAFLAPTLFNLNPDVAKEARLCILVVGVAASWQIALSSFAAVFVATQRFDLSNLIGVGSRLIVAGAVLMSLYLDYGLIGVAAATAVGTILEYSVRFLVARRLVPDAEVRMSLFSGKCLSEVWSFGLWNFLIALCNYVYVYLLPLVVAATMPIAAVGYYGLAAGLWHRVNSLFAPVGQVIYPAAAEMHVLGERDDLSKLNTIGSRLLMLVVIPVVLVAGVWADDFFRLWVGEVYVRGDQFVSVAVIFQVLLIATTLTYVTNIAGQILLGAGLIRPLAILKATGAVCTVLLSSLFLPRYGLISVSISAAVSVALVDIVGIALVLRQGQMISMAELFRYGLPRLFALSVLLFGGFSAIRSFSAPESWFELIVQGASAGLLSLLLVPLVGLTTYERSKVFARARNFSSTFSRSDGISP